MSKTLNRRPQPPAPERPPVQPAGPAEVERLLAELVGAYTALESLAREHRAAIARADGDAVGACARREAEIGAALFVLEERRRRIAASVRAQPGERITLTTVIERLGAADRGRLSAMAAGLRDLVGRVQREYRTIRAATQAIVAHMDGLVQQVGRRLADTPTYGRAGRLHAGRPAACGVDVVH
jgi:hypothetical protein